MFKAKSKVSLRVTGSTEEREVCVAGASMYLKN